LIDWMRYRWCSTRIQGRTWTRHWRWMVLIITSMIMMMMMMMIMMMMSDDDCVW
jgi:hypothetical protein